MPHLLVWPDNNMEYFEVTDCYFTDKSDMDKDKSLLSTIFIFWNI